MEALAERTWDAYGACHLLFNNAGVGAPSAKPWESTPNDWRWVFNVNVMGVANGVMAFVPRMIDDGHEGHVVNTSSPNGGISHLPTAAVYAASKAAVSSFTETLQNQFIADGLPLRASVFYPSGGMLKTGMWESDKSRPAELARERPRTTEAMTIEMLEERGEEGRLRPVVAGPERARPRGAAGHQGPAVRHHDRSRIDRRLDPRARRPPRAGRVPTTSGRRCAVVTYNFDPELRPFLDLLPTRPPVDASVPVDMATVRAYATQMMAEVNAAADVSALTIEDRVVPGSSDSPNVPVRVYAPVTRDATVAAILYIHGGGFTVGSIEMEHFNAVRLAGEVGVVVVSVEYRLAPESPFPAGLDDCYAALEWTHQNAATLGVDPHRIAIVGSSAGGGLAAGLALLARDRNGPPICFQFLGIPELDDRLETPSMLRFVDTPMWSRPSAEASWRAYLGAQYGGDVSPYAAPARATDLAGLPPAYVSTMEYDPLRDEGILYALRLLQCGVNVELHSFPGTWHGSTAITTATVTRRQVDEMAVVLRRALCMPN